MRDVRTLHLSRPAALEHAGPGSADTWSPLGPLAWLTVGALVFFAVPAVGADLLGLQPDWYYLAYFTVAVGWWAAFLAVYGAALRGLWPLNVAWSLVVGAVAGLGVTASVLGTAGTDHPDGLRWWFEIAWRGVVYGTVDAMVLFVFPAAVAYLVMRGDRRGAKRKLGYAGLVLALSLLMSGSYHLGYPEFRDSDLRLPLIGTVMAGAPAVLTGNPAGAVVTHVTAHVTAVVHQYEGGPTQMLPPASTESSSRE